MPTRDEVLALTDQISKLAAEVHGEREAKKWALRIVGAVLTLVIVFGGWGLYQNSQRIDDIQAARAEARENACEQENAGFRQGMLDVAKFIEASVTAKGRNPDGSLNEGNRKFLELLNTRFALRDCSPEGLSAYYEGAKP